MKLQTENKSFPNLAANDTNLNLNKLTASPI